MSFKEEKGWGKGVIQKIVSDDDSSEDSDDGTVRVFREALVGAFGDVPKKKWKNDIPSDPPIHFCVDPKNPSVIVHYCADVGCPNAFDPDDYPDTKWVETKKTKNVCGCGEEITGECRCEDCETPLCGLCSRQYCFRGLCRKVLCNKEGCTPMYECMYEGDLEIENMCHSCCVERIEKREGGWYMSFSDIARMQAYEKQKNEEENTEVENTK